MVEHLPADSPGRWHDTGGRPFTIGDQLAWRALWGTWQVQVLLARGLGLNKRAKMPADEMPPYPWERGKSADTQTLGTVDDDRKEEALDYLLALEQ